MTEQQQQFVDEFIALGNQMGLPRSMAKIWGWLLVCHPRHQSAHDIRTTLGLSAGSVSSTTQLLAGIGVVAKTKKRGERRVYYEIGAGSLTQTVKRRLEIIAAAKQLAERGLVADPGNLRLQNMRDVYTVFEEEAEHLLQRLNHIEK